MDKTIRKDSLANPLVKSFLSDTLEEIQFPEEEYPEMDGKSKDNSQLPKGTVLYDSPKYKKGGSSSDVSDGDIQYTKHEGSQESTESDEEQNYLDEFGSEVSESEQNDVIKSEADKSKTTDIKKQQAKSKEGDVLFPGFNVQNSKVANINLTLEDFEAFKELDCPKMAKIMATMNLESRMKLTEFLNNRKINILSIITKEQDFDLGILYFGLFSPIAVYHSMVANGTISEKNVRELLIVLLIKNEDMINEIKETYNRIYHIDLVEDITNVFPSRHTIICQLFNSSNYLLRVNEENYDSHANDIYEFIKNKDLEGLAKVLLSYHPTSYRGILSHFYKTNGRTLVEILDMLGNSPDIVEIFELINLAQCSPVYFYCSTIKTYLISNDTGNILPYILIYLNQNGLEFISEKYSKIYPVINPKNIAGRYGEKVGSFIYPILEQYFT